MKSKSKIKDYILIVIMCVVCIWVYKNQAIILDKIIMLNPHYIELNVADENRDIITIGEKVVDIKDLVGAPGRAKEQGGATLIYELPTPLEPGQYYLRIKGYTKKYAGRMLISLYDDENEQGYEGATFFSGIPMEYNMVIPADTTFNKVKLLWQNTENVPSLTDFQLVRLPEDQDINELEIGVKPEEGAIETITLGPEDKVVDGEVTCAVARGDALVYAQENRLCTLQDGKTEESIERDNIVNLYVDYYENLYVIFENGDMDVRYKDGSQKTYDWTNFEQKPVDVLVAGEYMFVPEGYGGVEIFKVEEDGIRYLSKLFVDNRFFFSKVVVRNHSAYALANGNVYWFDISYICNPSIKKHIHGGENTVDIQILGDILYTFNRNTDGNGSDNGRFIADKGTGMTAYKIEYAGNVNEIGGYRTVNTYSFGVKNSEDYEIKPIESMSIIEFIEEEQSVYDIRRTVTRENGIWILTDTGVYTCDMEEKIGNIRTKESILTKERENNYVPTYTSENREKFEIYALETGNVVKDVVVLRDYYVIGLPEEIAIYTKKHKELIYREKVQWNRLDAFDVQKKTFRDNSLILSYDNQLKVYEVNEGKMEAKQSYMLEIGNINSIFFSNFDEIVVCGNEGIVVVTVLNEKDRGELLEVNKLAKGENIQGVATETENGYVVYNTEGKLFYWNIKDKDEGLTRLELVVDDTNSMADENNTLENIWLWPSGYGYYVVYNQVMQTEDGEKYMLYKSEKQDICEEGEVLWRGFSILDSSFMHDGGRLQGHRSINKIFSVRQEDATGVIQLNKQYVITLRNKIYDMDETENQLITAVGRDGAIIFEKVDRENR